MKDELNALDAWPTVVHMLADAARLSPDALALVCGDDRLTYSQYAACVAGMAAELQLAGIEPGDRVALVMGNSVDIAIATFGVQAALAQVVPLNPAYTASELQPMLADAGCRAVIFDTAVAAVVRPIAESLQVDVLWEIGDGVRLTRWRSNAFGPNQLTLPDTHALSTLQYTGGTTGRSKGVSLTHSAVAVNVAQREALLPTEKEDERILAITPLFHVYAVAMGLYLAANCRGTLVILERYKPDLALRAIEQHGITLMSGSPTIFTGLMAYEGFESADLRSLRLCFSGAAALPAETLRRWESATGCTVVEGYGQSEAGPVLTYNPRHGIRKIASVGVPVPLTQVEIVDIGTGTRVLPVGEVGEIRARGPQVMQGYRGLDDETAAALREGWLYTGDIGELDADGYLFIRGRKKEMAIISGFNVYPREVEDALLTHPDVQDAGVVSIPDSYRGEALVAFVVSNGPAIDAAELMAYLAQRLVRYKVPKEIRVAESLPKTSIGKPDKNLLRAMCGSA